LPEADESAQAAEIESPFGSLKRAFVLVKRVAGADKSDSMATCVAIGSFAAVRGMSRSRLDRIMPGNDATISIDWRGSSHHHDGWVGHPRADSSYVLEAWTGGG
jgi:hypothetical protein